MRQAGPSLPAAAYLGLAMPSARTARTGSTKSSEDMGVSVLPQDPSSGAPYSESTLLCRFPSPLLCRGAKESAKLMYDSVKERGEEGAGAGFIGTGVVLRVGLWLPAC